MPPKSPLDKAACVVTTFPTPSMSLTTTLPVAPSTLGGDGLFSGRRAASASQEEFGSARPERTNMSNVMHRQGRKPRFVRQVDQVRKRAYELARSGRHIDCLTIE